MSGSEELRAALVSVEDQSTITALHDLQGEVIGCEELREAYARTQGIRMWVAQYHKPIREVQRVCNHHKEIIELQRQSPDRQTKQFLHPECDHTELTQQTRTLSNEQDEARKRPAARGTDEDLRKKSTEMTQDAQQFGDQVRSLSTQFANALTLAARVATAAPQAPEGRGQNFPDSPACSGSGQTQLRGWTDQLRMVI
jgi:hypothetical protein